MLNKLKEITNILTGYSLRGSISNFSTGSTAIVQGKDLSKYSLNLDVGALTKIDVEVESDSFLKKGDVLLLARATDATSFKAVVFDSDQTNILATSTVHILRIRSDQIIPKYLALWFNTPAGQHELRKVIRGSYIKALSRTAIETLSIQIPSFEEQYNLVALYESVTKMKSLLDKKKDLLDNLVPGSLKALIK